MFQDYHTLGPEYSYTFYICKYVDGYWGIKYMGYYQQPVDNSTQKVHISVNKYNIYTCTRH